MSVIESSYPPVDIPDDVDFVEFMLSAVDKYGNKPALVCSETNKTYQFNELRDIVKRITSGLLRSGTGRGHVVCACLPGCVEVFPLSLAVLSTGAAFTACNPTFTVDELRYQLADSDTSVVVTHASILDKVVEASEQQHVKGVYVIGKHSGRFSSIVKPFSVLENDNGELYPTRPLINPLRDVGAMFYSSGTTGRAKGVIHTHYTMVAMMKLVTEHNGMEYGPHTVQFTPVFHVTGYLGTLLILYQGGSVHVMPRFDLMNYLQLLEKTRADAVLIVPPIIMALANYPDLHRYDLSALRTVYVGAAHVGREAEELLQKKLGPLDIRQVYGLTESVPITLVPSGIENKPGSIGVLRPNTIGKISDIETGATLGPNKIGELCVKSPTTFKGYWKRPEANKTIYDSDGWLHTGDIAYYDEDKYFYIADRLKELVKYKGFQVPPAELESLLLGHPSVADVCVIGVPDAEAGELPKAYVVLKPGVRTTEAEIMNFVQDRVASYKRLRGGVQFVEQIPKSPSGKILRRILRDTEKFNVKSKI